MNQKTRNQESREQKNQKFLASMEEALKILKTKSNRLARGQITSSHFEQLNKLYPKDSAAFGSIANLKKASGLPRCKVVQCFQSISPVNKIQTILKNFSETESCCLPNKRNLVTRCGVYGKNCPT